MQYVLLVCPGDSWGQIPDLPDSEKQELVAEYSAINTAPGVTPGLPLGRPEHATTVRVENGETLLTDGPLAGIERTFGGFYVFEADDLDGAIELASRIPAARRGGAVEVRPVATYW
jgi:hypothetical protein